MVTESEIFTKVLSVKNLLELGSSEELMKLANDVFTSDFVQHNKDWTSIRVGYLSNALFRLAELDGVKVLDKKDNYKTFQIDYEFIRDCIPYIIDMEDPQELSGIYPATAVFKARMIWNTYTSLTNVFNENNVSFTSFVENFKPLEMFSKLFSGVSADVIANNDEEDFKGYLSTCDVEEQAKDIATAIFTVIPQSLKKYAVEDIFINQTPVLVDSRIPVYERLDLAYIQMLAYDNELSQALQIGWSNAVDGIMPKDLETIST